MGTPRPDAGHAATPARARRFDPNRRDLILRTALDLIGAVGTGTMTQRLIATTADVPLGSVTYHFPTRDGLVREAFSQFVEEQNAVFEGAIAAATTREKLLEVLTALVDAGPSRGRSGILGFELYLAALRDPRLRELTAAWTATSRAVLARVVGPDAAADLDAFLEGLILHALVSPSPVPIEETRASVARFLQTMPAHENRWNA